MKKKQDTSAAHELRDQPVPPVKGAVTVEEELCVRPENRLTGTQMPLGDSGSLESWL